MKSVLVQIDLSPNGCDCPLVTKTRDLDRQGDIYGKPGQCFDAITELKENDGSLITVRYCFCRTNVCLYLPFKAQNDPATPTNPTISPFTPPNDQNPPSPPFQTI